jgi:hypothetical protein
MTRIRFIILCASLTLLGVSPIAAAGIDFEGHAAANDSQILIGDEYAEETGATFVPTDDGATWDGVGAGDPGDWQIGGTNGSTFLGFDGNDYSISLYFDEPVEAFELDVARAAGSPPSSFDIFEVTGFLDGKIMESRAAYFGEVGAWKTVSLNTMVDRVVWYGTGRYGHRYGIDNLRWVGHEQEPQLFEVQIDVHPGSEKNPIQLGSRGVVPVVLYGEIDFAVEDVEISTLAFGPDAAVVAHRNGPHFDDIDGDGLLDMILHHRVADTGLTSEDSDVCLYGETMDAMPFEGCDEVTPVGR